MGSSGMMAGGAGGQEITLTINNSSLTQAFASASCGGSAAANPQEITLTISGLSLCIEDWSDKGTSPEQNLHSHGKSALIWTLGPRCLIQTASQNVAQIETCWFVCSQDAKWIKGSCSRKFP